MPARLSGYEPVGSSRDSFALNHPLRASRPSKLSQSNNRTRLVMQSLFRDWESLSNKAASNHSKVTEDIDRVISDLESLKDLIQRGSQIEGFQIKQNNGLQPIMNRSKAATKAALQSHKELYSLTSKWQKMIEKRFNQTVLPLLGTNLVPGHQNETPKPKQPFISQSAQQALNRVIIDHLLRQGRFETAQLFAQEAQATSSAHVLEACQELFRINDSLKAGDLDPALEWAARNRDWLEARESPLEFDLHRSRFVRLLTQPAFDHRSMNAASDKDAKDKIEVEVELGSKIAGDQKMESSSTDSAVDHPNPQTEVPIIIEPQASKLEPEDDQYPEEYTKSRQIALEYAQQHFPKFFPRRWDEAVRLTASSLYTPFSRLKQSPYSEFYRSAENAGVGDNYDCSELWLHADHLVPLFTKEFYARLDWSKELPLTVATELGSGGALAKIAKVRSVMKEKRTEWSQADELPVEIPLPMEFRFHSVFACPVSKEQSTDANPPMMMPCGHVIAKESMQKLAKGGGTVKCPYCPSSSSMSSAVQVYF
ncbi:hypothetical protein PTTG_01234 [Puccinia triticina 1-1 BBBD Race 1]|uniref:GID complex catalytic subunit 2 n=2 Tax=Puccinia triticina TaxID=208348 RepID=A0A180GZU5_PUCT1|nr:uncharacterized protein PtA15_10A466 [Puccinia triticina]OAV98044.1 hypothetical protein PTTG_01234 [Puccinia triticina 1-1 BBBD Race 1]WAQ89043.1 hypothetical protein PtA15_10A466 [Puccinia triticina]WAR59103.1 hypothetical protein PtB15_10B445 [Puccinia triticina]